MILVSPGGTVTSMEDPNDPKHRPFALEGEVPSALEQQRRIDAAKYDSGPLYGRFPAYPDRAISDERMMEEEAKRQEYIRACNGGVPDAPKDIEPANPTPWKGMRD